LWYAGGESRESFVVGEVVCEGFLGLEDFADCGSDFAMTDSTSIIAMPYWHGNRYISVVLAIKSCELS
jgi:hypothetical protein